MKTCSWKSTLRTSIFFLALGDDDENNIMASLLAKRLGARRVLALINQRSYADLMHGTQIDIALTPSQAMLGELLAYVRKGDVQAVHSLRRGVAEALELVVRGDKKTSRVVGREVGSLRLPEDVHIGLIVRGLPDELAETQADEAAQHEPEVIFPRTDTVLQSNDHVVFSCRTSAWWPRWSSCFASVRRFLKASDARCFTRFARAGHAAVAVCAVDVGALGDFLTTSAMA